MPSNSDFIYPLLSDGEWREAFPPGWLEEGETVASRGRISVSKIELAEDSTVVVYSTLPCGDELQIAVDLDEVDLVRVEPSSSSGTDPDYRDVVASLRWAEQQVSDNCAPIKVAELVEEPPRKATAKVLEVAEISPSPDVEPAPEPTSIPRETPSTAETPLAFSDWLKKVPTGTEGSPSEDSCVSYLLQPCRGGTSAHTIYGVVVHHRDPDGGLFAFPLHDVQAIEAPDVSAFDRPILTRLAAIAEAYPAHPVLPLEGEIGALVLGEMIASERCFLEDAPDPDEPLRLGVTLDCRATWVPDDEGLQRPGFVVSGNEMELAGVIPTSPPYYIHPEREACGRILSDLPPGMARVWLDAPEVDVEEASAVRAAMDDCAEALPKPIEFEIEEIQGTVLRPVLRLSDENLLTASGDLEIPGFDASEAAVATIVFDYSGKRMRNGRDCDHIRYRMGNTVYYIPRIHEAELVYVRALQGCGLYRLEDVIAETSQVKRRFHEAYLFPPDRKPDLLWRDFLDQHLDRLESDGWIIDIDECFSKNSVLPDEWFTRIRESENDGWFELECGVVIDGVEISLVRPLAQLAGSIAILSTKGDEPIEIEHPDGQGTIVLESAKVRQLVDTVGELFDKGSATADGNRVKIPELRAAELVTHERETLGLDAPASERLAYLSDRLRNLGNLPPAQPHDDFIANLRPYQLEGFRWLQFLREAGLSGVLADDMGLGKTVQTLCHLFLEHRSGRADGHPSIVVAPTSLVSNWAAEVEKFCPGMRTLQLEGPKRRKLYPFLGEVDVVITSYPILIRDLEILENQPFHCAILDEAQQIKNPTSQTSKSVRALTARYRLCLSGTPVENNLGELWSMFEFLIPGLLGSREAFRRVYEHPIENDSNTDRQSRLQRKLAPLMLRRTKESVATDLPPKTIVVHRIPLHSDQADLYNTQRASMKAAFGSEAGAEEPNSILIISALLKLRQVCCHPALLPEDASTLPTKGIRSAKLDHLLSLVDELAPAGRRILIFSQFTSMLDIIAAELKARNLTYCHLTGSTQDRGEVVKQFQEGTDPIFLISLKAGGTGLNLTKADVVIHYDPWWNPAAEAQATDRAYRIGQENPVFVYKLISEGTVEERILQLQAKKAALAEGLLGRGGSGAAFKVNDIDIDLLLSPVGAEGDV